MEEELRGNAGGGMFGEKKLRKLQDEIRNGGWRIQHISWLPPGKVERYGPGNLSTWCLIILGFACFFAGPALLSEAGFPIWAGISIMVFGLALLMFSRFSAGRFLYGRFVPVKAVCLDREVREFIDPDTVGDLIENTFWKPRILCEFEFRDKCYQVTPIIVKTLAFNTEEGVHRFLNKRLDSDGKCTLWIDPENPLHAVFHKKPKTGPYTA
jgi:hypothetical protein